MEDDKIMLNTNTLINFLRGELVEVELASDKKIFISEITEMEIQCQPNFNSDYRKKLKVFLSSLSIIRLNGEIRETAISIRLTTRMKLMDSIIAATAQLMNLPLATCDEKFESVKTAMIILLPAVEKR